MTVPTYIPVQAILQDHFDVPSRTTCSALSRFDSCSDWLSLNVELFFEQLFSKKGCRKFQEVGGRGGRTMQTNPSSFMFYLANIFWTNEPQKVVCSEVLISRLFLCFGRRGIVCEEEKARKRKGKNNQYIDNRIYFPNNIFPWKVCCSKK